MLHQELIEHFYHCLKYKKIDEMLACYHDDIEFTDPAFGTLKGEEVKNMWRMLLGKNTSLTIDYSNISADAFKGNGHWTASYVFSKTKRPVTNKITGYFEFKDEKIVRQIDSFDLHTWAKQAIGFKSTLLNGMGLLQLFIQRQSKDALKKYMANQ